MKTAAWISRTCFAMGQILGQVAPLAAGAQEVEDGVEQFALTVLAPTTGGRGLGETI